ncbi:COMM domain-containing protein 5 [Trichomycterus rosablanca]|uniref:COMM domain-containing protein 5 n=1 Tax=Trichomycterus rosablanca TaxID=2290929 RepID=UPI002F3502F2
MDQGGGAGGGAAGGFLGGSCAAEISLMVKKLQDVDQDQFRSILTAVVKVLEGGDCRELMMDLVQKYSIPEEKLGVIISGIYRLLKETLRLPQSSLKQEVFAQDLRDLRIPEEFITDFCSVVFGNRRAVLDAAVKDQMLRFPRLDDFRWRVDVSISTSSLARALQPSVLMQLKLSDGNLHQFEVSTSKFQELRYNVALVLKEMNDLEKRNVLRIQDSHPN